MQPPIFVFDSGDLIILNSVDEAERYLEPWFLDESDLYIYDRCATVLEATAERKGRSLFAREVVVIREKVPPKKDESDLRTRLAEYLRAVAERLQGVELSGPDPFSELSLPDLIEQASVYAGH